MIHNFELMNRSYSRQILTKSGANGLSLFILDNSEGSANPISFLFHKHVSQEALQRYAQGLYRYDPLIPREGSIYRNCSQFTGIGLWSSTQGQQAFYQNNAQTKPYWKYFSRLGFNETAVSFSSISKNLFLIIGLHSLGTRRHLCIEKSQPDMENWLDECRESVIHFSITKTLSKISDQEESEKLAALDEILTNRQFQVVCELLKGKSNKQIAYSLKLSEYTIENYLKKIYKIFNLHSRSALITLIKDQHYFS
ncbi:MAG: LuxR C-terminal-related transcriptional regulator [Porticoccaceae bacterium]|nr:response regulator transcription factor [Pseudomonadales bacterium]MCP5173095.1 response regulator transcription factor [Pseudomonadales bacterium]